MDCAVGVVHEHVVECWLRHVDGFDCDPEFGEQLWYELFVGVD